MTTHDLKWCDFHGPGTMETRTKGLGSEERSYFMRNGTVHQSATCPSCGGVWLLHDGFDDDPTVIDFGVDWPLCLLCCRELELGQYKIWNDDDTVTGLTPRNP